MCQWTKTDMDGKTVDLRSWIGELVTVTDKHERFTINGHFQCEPEIGNRCVVATMDSDLNVCDVQFTPGIINFISDERKVIWLD